MMNVVADLALEHGQWNLREILHAAQGVCLAAGSLRETFVKAVAEGPALLLAV
jgi:hypothetical protein